MRFILQQPSPIWKDFSIDNVKVYSQTIPPKDVRSKKENSRTKIQYLRKTNFLYINQFYQI